MKSNEVLDKLLANYRIWGAVASGSFFCLVVLLYFIVSSERTHMSVLLLVLFLGFLWIGSTSICRHSLVILKRYIHREMGVLEFLSTQLVAVLFPLAYSKICREVDAFRNSSGQNK